MERQVSYRRFGRGEAESICAYVQNDMNTRSCGSRHIDCVGPKSYAAIVHEVGIWYVHGT